MKLSELVESNMQHYYGSDAVDMKKLKKTISKDFDNLDDKTQDALVHIYHWLELNAKDLPNKKKVTSTVLKFYKTIANGGTGSWSSKQDKDIMKELLLNLKFLGINYPEFEAIEKSMRESK